MGFGHKGPKVRPQTDLEIQTASAMKPVSWVGGMTRVAPDLIDYVDFKAHKHKQRTGKGFGGSSTSFSYSATEVFELCEGVIAGVGKGWKDKGEVPDALGGFGFTLFTGTTPQAPWGYMAAEHPDHALGYPGTAYLAKANNDLGDSPTTGNYSFEVKGKQFNTQVDGAGDGDPALLVQEFLTDTLAGAFYPASFLDLVQILSTVDATTSGDACYQTYCRAMGFGLSPALTDQEPANDVVSRWAQLTNTAPVWTGYSTKLIPYCDQEVAGHGVTFTPALDVQANFTDDDYIGQPEETIGDPADAKNVVKLQIRDRANAYNDTPIPWQDQVSIETVGRRESGAIDGSEICSVAMGGVVVELIGQRLVNIRNSYRFTVDARYARLEPMDIVTLTCAQLGLVQLPVRIQSIEEDDDDRLTIDADEFPGSVHHSESVAGAGATPTTVNSLAIPSPVNPPLIFEPPSTVSAGVAQVWAAVSGGDGTTADPNWGGCTVYASSDGVSYQPIGVIDGPARMGKTAGALAAYAGANPDTVHSVDVDLAMSAGELEDASEDEAAAAVTLSYVEDVAGGNGEFFSFRDATLAGTSTYTLEGSLYRALYGSAGTLHALGSRFARLDQSIFKYDLPPAWIGVTLHFKFTSFNIFGQAEEDLADVADYTFTPAGVGMSGGVQLVEASEAITAAPAVVNIWDSGGDKVRLADASTLPKRAHGFVLSPAGLGDKVLVYFLGKMTGLSGLTPGGTVYLSTIAGEVTQVPPTGSGEILQPIGVADGATSLEFNPAQPVERA